MASSHPGRASRSSYARRNDRARAQAAPRPRAAEPAGIEVNLPGKGEVLLTRRHFLYGIAGLAAIAAIGGGGYAYSQASANSSGDVATLSVPEGSVFSSDDCTQIEDASTVVSMTASHELPYGSLVWASDDSIAACLLPTETSKPLCQIGLLALGSGDCTTVVKHAVGEDDGFEIYDVRACSNGLVWTEADILEGIWRVYHATVNGVEVGEPALVEEGDSNWEMPTLAAAGGYAFWQMVPRTDGNASTERSKLKRARFGDSNVEEIYTSRGRMACAPCACGDGVVITPRAETSGTYYQLTRIDAASGQTTDALVLPSSMKPLEAAYGETGFSFAFESIYNYGAGIANLGTYTPVALPGSNLTGAAAAESYGAATWFRFGRTPSAAPAWCGKWFVVKSTSSVCGVDLDSRQYFAISADNGADDYGEYLATTGTASRIVTFANIDYQPLSGEAQKCCRVKIWETKS